MSGKLETPGLILAQEHRGSAFQGFTETMITFNQPNQLPSQSLVFEI